MPECGPCGLNVRFAQECGSALWACAQCGHQFGFEYPFGPWLSPNGVSHCGACVYGEEVHPHAGSGPWIPVALQA